MSAHTPGPWVRRWSHTDWYEGEQRIVRETGRIDGPIGTICDLAMTRDVDANARLIAASPDMLAALYRARDQIREFLPTVLGDALTDIEAAIAKAEGKR